METLGKIFKQTAIYTAAFGTLFLIGGFAGGKALIALSIFCGILYGLNTLTVKLISKFKK